MEIAIDAIATKALTAAKPWTVSAVDSPTRAAVDRRRVPRAGKTQTTHTKLKMEKYTMTETKPELVAHVAKTLEGVDEELASDLVSSGSCRETPGFRVLC